MTAKLQIHIGKSLIDSKHRVLDAVARYKRGERVIENHVTFESWNALAKVMTDKRYQMLRHLREHPTSSIRALADALGRDYKRVHGDVHALTAAGLVAHDNNIYRAEYDVIQTTVPL